MCQILLGHVNCQQEMENNMPMNPMEQRRMKSMLIMGGTILTIILAVAVVSIALLLEKRGSQPAAPNAPGSVPRAATSQLCSLQFTVNPSASPSPSVTPSPTPSVTPSPTPSVTPSPTPTVSPVPSPTPLSCNSTCNASNGNADCQSGLVCSGGFCRNPSCTGNSNCLCSSPIPSPTPPAGCNNGCATNSDCGSGMTCSSGLCRNPSCVSSPNCLCASTPTPTTTITSSPTPPPQLPKSGSVIQTGTIFGLGSIITILGVIGFFAL